MRIFRSCTCLVNSFAHGVFLRVLFISHNVFESRKREEEEDAKLAKIVYVERDMVPQAYSSETKEATMAEVDSLSVKCSRPLIKISITRERREFGANCKFNDRDAEQCGLVECSEFLIMRICLKEERNGSRRALVYQSLLVMHLNYSCPSL